MINKQKTIYFFNIRYLLMFTCVIIFYQVNGMLNSDAELFKKALLFDEYSKVWTERKEIGDDINIPLGVFKGSYYVISKKIDFFDMVSFDNEKYKSAEVIYFIQKKGFIFNKNIEFSYLNKYKNKEGELIAEEFIQYGPRVFCIESESELTTPAKATFSLIALAGIISFIQFIRR